MYKNELLWLFAPKNKWSLDYPSDKSSMKTKLLQEVGKTGKTGKESERRVSKSSSQAVFDFLNSASNLFCRVFFLTNIDTSFPPFSSKRKIFTTEMKIPSSKEQALNE